MCFSVCAAGAGMGLLGLLRLTPGPKPERDGFSTTWKQPPSVYQRRVLVRASGPACGPEDGRFNSRRWRPIAVFNHSQKGGLFIKQVNHQKQLKMKKKALVWSAFKEQQGRGGLSHLARHYRGGTVASSSFFFASPHFYVEEMAPSRASLALGGSRPPFPRMPALITHNNHGADGARWSVRNALILPCVLERQKLERSRGVSPPQRSAR